MVRSISVGAGEFLGVRAGAHAGGLRGLEPPLNGNRLNTNLLLTFVKTQHNSAHAYIQSRRHGGLWCA